MSKNRSVATEKSEGRFGPVVGEEGFDACELQNYYTKYKKIC